MDETNPLDLDRLADLRLQLRHTREPDRALGCAIITLLLPGTIAAGAAEGWLAQSEVIGVGLDITGSVDDALRFLGQLRFGPGWSIIQERLDDEPVSSSEGRHRAWLRHRFFDCLGSGHTAAVALVDVAIHATALGAADYGEEDLPPLVSSGGSTRTDDEGVSSEVGAVSEPMEGWSDNPVERTRQVLAEFWPNLDIQGRICLKNCDGRFGAVDGYDLQAGILRVVDRDAATSMRFARVEDLLAAGWVLDQGIGPRTPPSRVQSHLAASHCSRGSEFDVHCNGLRLNFSIRSAALGRNQRRKQVPLGHIPARFTAAIPALIGHLGEGVVPLVLRKDHSAQGR